jgi:hypothetical protein
MADDAHLVDLIEIVCFQCGRPFQICFGDYRGQRYCLEGECQELGYRARTRERGRAYQGRENGRKNHAGRQQALRDRRADGEASSLVSCGGTPPPSDEPVSTAHEAAPEPIGRAARPAGEAGGPVPDRPAEISPQPGCGFCDRDDADVTHGAPIQTSPPADTVLLKGQPSGGEEVSDAGSRGRDLGARGGGPEPDRPPPARPRLPRLYQCFVCEKVGLVVFRISKERPEGVRVGRSRGA